jgi:hypothetical protein
MVGGSLIISLPIAVPYDFTIADISSICASHFLTDQKKRSILEENIGWITPNARMEYAQG